MQIASILLFSLVSSEKLLGSELILNEAKTSTNFEQLIGDILVRSIEPYQHVTIIYDSIYSSMLTESFLGKFDLYVSFIMIAVEDSEDLYSPYPKTQQALVTAKTVGCQFYLILIANGIQVSRFLMFGDRYRVLNTRANFLMLYDRRLFVKDLHYLWRRIINVAFVREYGSIKKIGAVSKSMPWFEIVTVPFPSPIREVLIPRRLDIWRRAKFHTGSKLFVDKTSNLENQTVKAVTFTHVPATTKIELPKHKTVRTVMGEGPLVFSGIEVEILQAIASAMNFVPCLYEPPDADAAEPWGEKRPDGQYSGMIGEMVKSSAEFALGDLYYTPYFLKTMDLSVPYNTECLTFLTPESLTNNSWKTLILPFTPVLWAAVLICLFLIGFIFYGLSHFHDEINRILFGDLKARKLALKAEIREANNAQLVKASSAGAKYILMKKEHRQPRIEGEPIGLYLFGNLTNSILYTYGMLLVVSLPKLPTGWSIRMLTGWYWLYCALVVVAYKASMTAILANPAPRLTIDTLEELVDSKLAYGGWGEINREFFKTSPDRASRAIGSRFETVNDSDDALDRIVKGSFAFYENEHFLRYASVKKEMNLRVLGTNESGGNELDKTPSTSHRLHIMSDCLIHMPISIGLQKNSPIKPKVDKLIRRFLEAGLIKKWLGDVMRTTINAEVHLKSHESVKALMDMRKFFGALVALFVGYFVSVVALICEMFHFEYVYKRHPDYDKYSKQVS